MDKRPELLEGYLGEQQPKFDEVGLVLDSHREPDISIRENQLQICIKSKQPIKATHLLFHANTGKDMSEYVFTQSKDKTVTFVIHLPESSFYKFQIYALPLSNESKELPNVYNYLIQCTRAMIPVYPFPRQYAQWKNGCYLYDPMVLNAAVKLTNIYWHVIVPDAKQVAVVADGEWYMFDKGTGSGNEFKSKFNLDHLRGKDAKVLLTACFTDDESKYSTLLEYKI